MLVCISGSGCVNARRIHSRAVLHHRPRESLLGETTSATPPCTYSLKFQLSIVLVCCLDDVVVMSQTKLVGKVRTSMAISAHNGVLWALRDKSVAQSVSHYQALCGHHWLSVHVQRGKPTLVNMFEGSTHLSFGQVSRRHASPGSCLYPSYSHATIHCQETRDVQHGACSSHGEGGDPGK